MPSAPVLIGALGAVLALLVMARVALDGQIRRARARAQAQERAWREQQAAEEAGTPPPGEG